MLNKEDIGIMRVKERTRYKGCQTKNIVIMRVKERTRYKGCQTKNIVIMRVKRQNIIGIISVKQRTHSGNDSQTGNIIV